MDALGTESSGLRPRSKAPVLANGPLSKRDYTIGIIFLLAVVLLWTTSNFVTQNLFINGYEKPFLVTYLNTSAFTFYLPLFFTRRFWMKAADTPNAVRDSRRRSFSRAAEEYQPLATTEPSEEIDGDTLLTSSITPVSTTVETSYNEVDLVSLNVRQTAELAFAFCFLWFIANWAVNASLDYTTVASSTILASTSGFFTLGIGRIFRVERLTRIKIAAVFICFAGVLLVSLSDSTQSGNPASPNPRTDSNSTAVVFEHASSPLLGDFLSLVSALFYALYVILLKVRIKDEKRIDMQLFFGLVGLFNILACWPIGFILNWTGVETFELPTKAAEWYAIMINMLITWSSDYLYVLAMLKTTPLVVTVGLSLTIPVAVLGDLILNVPVRAQVIVGATLVLVGFVSIGSDNSNTEKNNTMAVQTRTDT